MTEPLLQCDVCGERCSLRINGRCPKCNPFLACKKCRIGTYESKPIPSWQTRHICDHCNHKISK